MQDKRSRRWPQRHREPVEVASVHVVVRANAPAGFAPANVAPTDRDLVLALRERSSDIEARLSRAVKRRLGPNYEAVDLSIAPSDSVELVAIILAIGGAIMTYGEVRDGLDTIVGDFERILRRDDYVVPGVESLDVEEGFWQPAYGLLAAEREARTPGRPLGRSDPIRLLAVGVVLLVLAYLGVIGVILAAKL